MCLALADDGTLYAGGGTRGLLYRIEGKDKGSVLHEFSEPEVRALTIVGDDIYVGVNEQRVEQKAPGRTRKHAATFEDATDELVGRYDAELDIDVVSDDRNNSRAGRGGGLSGVLYVRHKDGLVDKMSEWPGQAVVDMVGVKDDSILVAMANKGQVYRVTKKRRWELIFDFDARDAMTLAVYEGRLVFAGTGNIGEAHVVEHERDKPGEFTSVVHDCRFPTTWGNVSWRGRGVKVATRTGNTLIPDATWSGWSPHMTTSPEPIQSPSARYLQVRSTLEASEESHLTEIVAYFMSQNQRPLVSSVEVEAKQSPYKTMSGGDKDTQSDPTSRPGNASNEKSSEAASGSRKKSTRGKGVAARKISWAAEDQDGDILAYRLFYREAEDDTFIPMPILKPLLTTEYIWDTEAVPDGRYRVKVAASDEKSNPVDQMLSGDRESEIITVDNRRPLVEDLVYDRAKARLSGVARDRSSLIHQIEYSVNGAEWQLVSPIDGVFDNSEERFVIKITDPKAAHWVAVRAIDAEGNAGVERLKIEKEVE